MEFEEIRFANGAFRIGPKDIERPRSLTSIEKKALNEKHTFLGQKAEVRQETCWSLGCSRKATHWVREVGFDFKGDKAAPVQHVAVSSTDYPGPVPGFCTFCLGLGPKELAEAVYFDRPEIYWGVRPTRWWVSFTDDTRQGGSCVELNEKLGLPKYTETHV